MTDYLKTGRKISNPTPDGKWMLVDEYLTSDQVNERLSRMGSLRRDLEAAVVAIRALENDAEEKRREHDRVNTALATLKDDTQAAEQLLRIPEESIVRILSRATKRERWRGRLEGVVIGLVTGAASSWIVWYATTFWYRA